MNNIDDPLAHVPESPVPDAEIIDYNDPWYACMRPLDIDELYRTALKVVLNPMIKTAPVYNDIMSNVDDLIELFSGFRGEPISSYSASNIDFFENKGIRIIASSTPCGINNVKLSLNDIISIFPHLDVRMIFFNNQTRVQPARLLKYSISQITDKNDPIIVARILVSVSILFDLVFFTKASRLIMEK